MITTWSASVSAIPASGTEWWTAAAGQGAEPLPDAHDVVVSDGLAAVLAVGDRDRLAAGHHEQPHRGRRAAAATDVDLEGAVLAGEPDWKRELSLQLGERLLGRAAVAAAAPGGA